MLPVGKAPPSPTQPQQRAPCVMHQFPRRAEDQKPQTLGSRGDQFSRQRQPLQRCQHVVGQHRQPQPGRVGPEASARHHPARQLVLDHVVHRLDRTRLLPVPLQQLLRRPLPQIGHHREVLHRAAVGKQLSLLLANPDRHIPQRFAIAMRGAFFRDIIHFGALFDRRAVFAVRLPLRFRRGYDRGAQPRVHARAHRKPNQARRPIGPLFIAQPVQQARFVAGRIPAKVAFRNRLGQRLKPPLGHPQQPLLRRHIAVAELVGHHHLHLRPQRQHRLIAAASFVSGLGLPLPTFDHRGVQIHSGDLLIRATPPQLLHYVLVHPWLRRETGREISAPPRRSAPGSIKGDVKRKHFPLCWRNSSSLTSSPFGRAWWRRSPVRWWFSRPRYEVLQLLKSMSTTLPSHARRRALEAVTTMGRFRLAPCSACRNRGRFYFPFFPFFATSNVCDLTIPSPSFTTINWFTLMSFSVSTWPLGQRISIRSALSALPKPKWTRRSFCEM